MPADPKLRTTIIQAFAVTVAAPSGGSQEPASVPGSAPGSAPDKEAVTSTTMEGRGSAPPRGPSILPERGHRGGGLYRLVRLLGQGMFGKVYVAQRVDVPEHQVALKLLPRSLYATRNVERELVMLATVGHPNVVQLKDHGMTADYVWLTMPVYEGETLAERLARGPIDAREAHDIFVPIARGLDALHAAGLRHQDVKPDNIYLARFGGRVHPILLDLGVAAEKEATFCAGTALYAAPEQVRALNAFPGAVPLNEKMDTYGLGATLLFALAGPQGFPGETAATRTELGQAHEIRAQRPLGLGVLPELTGRPRELLSEAFKRWLALDPADRPSMSELAEQLDVLLEPEREAAREEERRQARQKAALLRFRIAAGALLLAAVAGALVAFSKRETIQLAQELERARREGAESFDKLDTCVASYRLSESNATACRVAREKDRVEHQRAMAAIERSGATEAERAREVQSLQSMYAGRLKACEDEAAAAAKEAVAARESMTQAWEKERAALAAERDEQRALADKRAADLATLTAQREACDAAHASCIAERDRCQTFCVDPSVAPASHTTRPGPAPPAPPAPPTASAPPASTASAGAGPAPPPTASAPPASSAPPLSTSDVVEPYQP
ncbi:MAG: serine/threonine protein kinase [Polyangiaceae bacterium]|nr:serine/threonine protein kinase [Polyangiaceae bacterium]